MHQGGSHREPCTQSQPLAVHLDGSPGCSPGPDPLLLIPASAARTLPDAEPAAADREEPQCVSHPPPPTPFCAVAAAAAAGRPPAPLPDAELAAADPEELRYAVGVLEEEMRGMNVDLGALEAYRAKAAEYGERVGELEAATAQRDEVRWGGWGGPRRVRQGLWGCFWAGEGTEFGEREAELGAVTAQRDDVSEGCVGGHRVVRGQSIGSRWRSWMR